MNANQRRFQEVLERHYDHLFLHDSDYHYAISIGKTPASMAAKMTAGLVDGTANKDGKGVIRTCKELGIKHTYKAMAAYFQGEPAA